MFATKLRYRKLEEVGLKITWRWRSHSPTIFFAFGCTKRLQIRFRISKEFLNELTSSEDKGWSQKKDAAEADSYADLHDSFNFAFKYFWAENSTLLFVQLNQKSCRVDEVCVGWLSIYGWWREIREKVGQLISALLIKLHLDRLENPEQIHHYCHFNQTSQSGIIDHVELLNQDSKHFVIRTGLYMRYMTDVD